MKGSRCSLAVHLLEGMTDDTGPTIVGEIDLIVEEITEASLTVVEQEAVTLTVDETDSVTAVDLTVEETTELDLTVTEQDTISLIVNEGTEAMVKWELEVVRGANSTQRLNFKQADGSAFDLTGHTVHWTLRRREKDNKALVSKSSTVTAQIEIIAPATNGIADLKIVPADTKDLEPSKMVHDVWIEKSSGEKIPVVKTSLFNLIWEVTRLS